MTDYTMIPELEKLIDAIQPESIISRTFYKDGQMKAILLRVRYGAATQRTYLQPNSDHSDLEGRSYGYPGR